MSPESAMRFIIWFSFLISKALSQTTFRVFTNTLDPSVFGTNGGATLKASGDGLVDALTICLRFQAWHILSHCFSDNKKFSSRSSLSLQSWEEVTGVLEVNWSISLIGRTTQVIMDAVCSWQGWWPSSSSKSLQIIYRQAYYIPINDSAHARKFLHVSFLVNK